MASRIWDSRDSLDPATGPNLTGPLPFRIDKHRQEPAGDTYPRYVSPNALAQLDLVHGGLDAGFVLVAARRARDGEGAEDVAAAHDQHRALAGCADGGVILDLGVELGIGLGLGDHLAGRHLVLERCGDLGLGHAL